MKYELTPKTFFVTEIFNPRLSETGLYYYYTLEKAGVSHKETQKRIGTTAYFCGVKDKNATTKQWFCTKEQLLLEEINEPNFIVKYKGSSNERIFVGKHKGNSFKALVELEPNETKSLKYFKPKNEFVCNYFGEQRFSENTISICNALETGDYEGALKIFLTKKSIFDSNKSTAIKSVIQKNWGEWEKILNSEEVAGTGKEELFIFLNSNPFDFKGAFLHTEEKSTRILVKAAQSLRFNSQLAKLAQAKKPNGIKSHIVGQEIGGIVGMSASKAFPRKIIISPTKFEENFRKSTLERKTFFTAQKFKAKRREANNYEISFELGKGEYATIFLKFLQNWLKNS